MKFGKVNSELSVRFNDNDYSVPMEYAYHDVNFANQKEGSNRIARTQTIHPTTDKMTGKNIPTDRDLCTY